MQSRFVSLLEVAVNTAIGFCISLVATLTILPALGVAASVGQSVYMSLAFTVISIARGYVLRRVFNRRLQRAGGINPPTHYHVDRAGISVYRGGVQVARIDMNKDQLIGMAAAILKASREITATSITSYLRD